MGIIVRERLHRFRTAVSVHCNAGSRILKKQTAMPTKDPQKKHPNPPYRQPMQEPPGSERDMSPKADHGEKSYKGNKKLEGRVALITGGDSGIGRAVAIAFAREGADLLISYLSEHEDAEDTANLVEKEGRRCITAAGDISEERQCIALVDQCVGELGRLDLLVNNAAHQRTKDDIQHFTSREFKYTFETNVYAMFYLCKAALPHLQPGSSIINVASIQAYQPSPNLRVRRDQRRYRHVHESAGGYGYREGSACKRGCPRANMDSADSINDAKRKSKAVRQEHADGPGGAARRTRPGFRLPRLPRLQLYHR